MKKYCLLCVLFISIALCTACSSKKKPTGENAGSEGAMVSQGDRPADSEGTTVTGTGNEYFARVADDKTASIEYLGARMDINEWEWVKDDFEDTTWFCLKMSFYNEFSTVHEDDFSEERLRDSLDASFYVQALQDGEVVMPRDGSEAETNEEENVYERIDEGRSIECEYWFPVDADKDVTIQVLNIDGQDTVMAEIQYKPAADEDDAFDDDF